METAFNLTDMTNTLLQDIAPAKTMITAVIGLRIGSLGFLVSREIICEMLDKVPVNALPNVPPCLSGLLNFRGNLVPVFDLRVILAEELPDKEAKKRHLCMIDRGNNAAAVWIDSFPVLKDGFYLQPLHSLPPLPPLLQRFVTGGFEELDGQVWLSVNYNDLFKSLGQQPLLTTEVRA